MTRSLAKRLVEPDHWTSPDGHRKRPVLTYGPAVTDLCAQAGYEPDPQQQLGLDLVFAIRPDGSPESFSFAVICARQNLKSGLFLQCVIGWLFVTEVPEVAWSAHELRTSLNAQEELFSILDTPTLSKYLPPPSREGGDGGKYETNGKERQELTTGQTVWFQTRTRDGGRGLGKPKVIIDEAFKFKKRTAGALLPILLAQHHPQLLYGSSQPPLDPDAEHLRDVIDRGRKHKSPAMSYIEWLAPREDCADPDCTHPKDALARGLDCALDREHLLRRANPTLTTGRITLDTLRNLRQELDPDEYMRECMGWEESEDSAGPPAIDTKRWHRDVSDGGLRGTGEESLVKACAVLYTEPDRSVTSIGLAGVTVDGERLVLERTGEGESWVVGSLEAIRERTDLLEVALHPKGQAKNLIPSLKAAGIEWHKLTLDDYSGGCSALLNGVAAGDLRHIGQARLDAAVNVARTRTTESQDWVTKGAPVPLAPLRAVSTALYRYALIHSDPAKTPMVHRWPTDDEEVGA